MSRPPTFPGHLDSPLQVRVWCWLQGWRFRQSVLRRGKPLQVQVEIPGWVRQGEQGQRLLSLQARQYLHLLLQATYGMRPKLRQATALRRKLLKGMTERQRTVWRPTADVDLRHCRSMLVLEAALKIL